MHMYTMYSYTYCACRIYMQATLCITYAMQCRYKQVRSFDYTTKECPNSSLLTVYRIRVLCSVSEPVGAWYMAWVMSPPLYTLILTWFVGTTAKFKRIAQTCFFCCWGTQTHKSTMEHTFTMGTCMYVVSETFMGGYLILNYYLG